MRKSSGLVGRMPDELRRQLQERADAAGLSLSDYLSLEAQWAVKRPTLEEWLARLARRPKCEPLDPSAAEIIRQQREDR
jgi:hypothetical protein